MPRKRAPNGSGCIRQRKDGLWEGIFSLGYNAGTGKLIRKSVYGATSDEVAKKLRKATSTIDDGLYIEPEKLTVGQWLDLWLTEYTGDLKPRTLDQYSMHVRLNLKPHLGAVQLLALAPHMIQSVYNKLLRRKNPLSPKSIRNLNGVLHSCMNKAVALGYIRANPCDPVTLPRVVKKEMQTIKDENVTAFLEAISGHEYEAVYMIDLFTGMRQGEILGLTWPCVDLQKGVIHIKRQLQKERRAGGQYALVPLKNDKERAITPAPFIMDMLIEQKRKQATWKLRSGGTWNNPMNLVFTNEQGRYLAPSTVYNNFKRIVKTLGLDDVRFHDLRHSYASLSLQNGDDIKTVQENLGHSTPTFTLSVYAHSGNQAKRTSAERMEEKYQNLRQSK